jgi:rhodanese-related sulfurtransferase
MDGFSEVAIALSYMHTNNARSNGMKRISFLFAVLLIAVITFAACAGGSSIPVEGKEVQVNGGYYIGINPAQLQSMLDTKDFLLVNVHIPYQGEIPQTDLFVPYNQIEENLSQFPQDKEAKIVVYCRSGSMSAIAAKTLVKLGFSNVWDLDDGMVEWERQGYELIHKPQ